MRGNRRDSPAARGRAVRLEGIGGMRGVAESERSGDPAGDRARGVGGDGDRAAPNRSVAVAARARRVARERGGAIDASVDTARGGVALGRGRGAPSAPGAASARDSWRREARERAKTSAGSWRVRRDVTAVLYLARSRVREKVGLAGPPRLGPAVRTVRRRKSDRQKVDAWTRPFRVSSSEKKSSVD